MRTTLVLILLALLAVAAFVPPETISKSFISLTQPISSTTAATPVVLQKREWKLDIVEEVPMVVSETETSALGVLAGNEQMSDKVEWWLFYSEAIETPFLLVLASVDGNVISLCEEATEVECDYRAGPLGGSSVLALTTDQVKLLQQGKELELVFFMNDQFISVKYSLAGINQPIEDLLTTGPAPKKDPKLVET